MERDPERDQLWMLWYIRATMREIGLPSAAFNADYQKAILKATLKDEITEQLAYHKSTHKTLHHIDHFLHWTGTISFGVTALILVGFLVLFGFHLALHNEHLEHFLIVIKPWVTLLSAGLPALGAAVTGIRVQGDFEGSDERSVDMVNELTEMTADYEKAIAHAVTLDETAEMLILTAGRMSADVAVWQELYGRKRLALPA
jgi:hypothetical protein